MWSYILKRLLLMIPTLIGVLTLTFAVIQFVPGGPVEQAVHELRRNTAEGGAPFGLRAHSGVDAQQVAQLKALYGFDKPPLERYWLMLKRFSHFDLGQSYFRHQSVWSLIVSKLPVSISIGLWTFFLTYLISVPLGIAKAVRNGSRFDVATSLIVLIGYAIPGFVLGVLLLVLFGGGTFLQLFPLRNLTSDNWAQLTLSGKILDYLWHITLPIVASVVGSFAVVTMLTKNAFLDEIRKQYVLTAREGAVRAARAVEARVSQCAIAVDRRLSGGVHRRVLHGQSADRDALLARWARAAVVRVGGSARLSRCARHAVSLHADRARDQAHLRSLLRVGRSTHSIRTTGALI
jgi:microcin C transport system permease protein